MMAPTDKILTDTFQVLSNQAWTGISAIVSIIVSIIAFRQSRKSQNNQQQLPPAKKSFYMQTYKSIHMNLSLSPAVCQKLCKSAGSG